LILEVVVHMDKTWVLGDLHWSLDLRLEAAGNSSKGRIFNASRCKLMESGGQSMSHSEALGILIAFPETEAGNCSETRDVEQLTLVYCDALWEDGL
jgi:hypothetical protein